MAEIPSSARMLLATPPGVVQLDPGEHALRAMMQGWSSEQRSRGLARATIEGREIMLRRFVRFTNAYPWQWTAADVDDFTSSVQSGSHPLSKSSIRSYHVCLRGFMAYLTSPDYGWREASFELFGEPPIQICHEWNTMKHLVDYEGGAARRPFTYDEIQLFFDVADDMSVRRGVSRVRGRVALMRDAQVFKTAYAFGLRRREVTMLEVADLHYNASIPEWGPYGALEVRHGKASRGGPPRRRTVLAVPEFDWAVQGLRQWTEELRSEFDVGRSPRLWLSERGGSISERALGYRFAEFRDAAGIDKNLTMHSLRHSYVTHLIEFGYAERFVQVQVGHATASTTAIYTGVSDDFMRRTVASAMGRIVEGIRK
jgi:site-specific recombinase XerD